MNAHGCCQTAAVGDGVMLRTRIGVSGPRRGTRTARVVETARWIVPGAILALLPKCPACLAAYIAMGSGMGISVVAAGYVRTGLIGLSAVSLGYFVVRRLIVACRGTESKSPPCLAKERRDKDGAPVPISR